MRRLVAGLLVVATVAPATAVAVEDQPAAAPPGAAAPAAGAAASVQSSAPPMSPTMRRAAEFLKGSTLTFDNSITPDVIAPSVQLSSVPSYEMWFSLRPRMNFRPDLSLRLRFDLTIEWLNAAETTLYREPRFGDIWTDVVYSGIPKFGGIGTSVGLRLLFPTSKLSIARGNILNVSLTLGFTRSVTLRRGGSLDFGLSGAGGHTFTQNDGSIGQQAYQCTSLDFRSEQCVQVSGTKNTAFAFTGVLSAKYSPIKRLSISAAYVAIYGLAYPVPAATVQDSVTGTTATAGGSAGDKNDQRLRQSGWFLANVDVDATSWLTFSLGYYVYRPILDPNATYGNPFWSPGGNSRIFFSTTFAIDSLMESAAAAGSRRGRGGREAASATVPQGHPQARL